MVDPATLAAHAPPVPAPAESLVRDTWILDPPDTVDRRDVLRPEAAAIVDGLLARVARGRGALDVAIGELLDALSVGSRLMQLGYARPRDYVRERLGMEETAGRNLAKLARELRARPFLREAVRCGDVSARKALAVLPVARGEEETAWVERARTGTVRALEAAVRAARCGTAAGFPGSAGLRDGAVNPRIAAAHDGPAAIEVAREVADGAVEAARASAGAAAGEDDAWERVRIDMTPEDREKLERALSLAGRVLGAGAPRWARLEVVCQEYLGYHPDPAVDRAEEDGGAEVRHEPFREWLEGAKAALEEEMGRWSFLEPVAPVQAPVVEAMPGEALALDARLRELAAMRARWDVLLGHLAMLVRKLGLWREAGFASFAHYCEERLGMSARTVEQRAWLAERSYELPGLREAMADGRLAYEKARLVARVADDETIGGWIERARATTAIDLRRELEAAEDAQMRARGELQVVVPRPVRVLVDAVVRAARAAEERWLKPGECLGIAAEHFLATWEGLVPRRRTRTQRILERDGGCCLVPGCSRPAEQAHHVRFRSAGGGDEDWNLGSMCPPHHLYGIHQGWITVTGEAPDRLVFTMAAPPAGFPGVPAA